MHPIFRVSQKLAKPIQFLKYLNKLHVLERQSLEVERDLICWKCGKAFGPDDFILPQKGVGGAARKKRCPDCAFTLGMITKKDLERLKHFKNFIFVSLMAGWLMVIGQSYFLING